MALETAWKQYKTLLVSDASEKLAPQADPPTDWMRQSQRVSDIMSNQVYDLRLRVLMSAIQTKERIGAYWDIGSNILNYQVPNPLPAPYETTKQLAIIPTRLEAMDSPTQERLINWGYAISDAAIRKYIDPQIPPPSHYPYSQPF